MKTIKIRITTTEEMLGTASADPGLHTSYIASKAPNAPSLEEEVAAIGVDEVAEKAMTVFPRVNGQPIMWDYQMKGFFKDACGVLRKVTGTESSKIKAFKKEIDGLIFVSPRAIPIKTDGTVSTCQRPLRASTPQGERIALVSSESIPAGAVLEFEVLCMVDAHEKLIKEWMEYGKFRGLGQWRNSGKGRFNYEIID